MCLGVCVFSSRPRRLEDVPFCAFCDDGQWTADAPLLIVLFVVAAYISVGNTYTCWQAINQSINLASHLTRLDCFQVYATATEAKP